MRHLCVIALPALGNAPTLSAQPLGGPPLAAGTLEGCAQFYEWALDLRLTEPQYRELGRLLADRWTRRGGAARADILKTRDRWADITRLRVTERSQLQLRLQDSILARLRRSASGDELDRWLLARRDDNHRALAPGSPPLTQVLAARKADYWEWVFDLRLGERERRELQQLEIAMWAKRDAGWKRTWMTFIPAWWTTMASLGPVERTLLRVQARTNVLAEMRKDPAEPYNRWLLARYQAAHRPGGTMNPILVPGGTPLSEDMVTQYAEFVEWRWRLLLTGLGAQQRRQLRQVVIADWRKGDDAARRAFLADLAWWLEVFPGLTDAQRQDVIYKNEHMGAYLERLRRSPDAAARGWYLALEALALETFKWRASLQNMYFETWRSMIESNRATMTQIAQNMAPSGRYDYNPLTGAYDRYVPYSRW